MKPTNPIARQRSTTATAQRIANIKGLVLALAAGEMQADDICAHLKMSPSGARKYIRDLLDAGVMELARYVGTTATYAGKAVYRLTDDATRVSDFLELIERNQFEPRIPAPTVRKLPTAAGRHFHILLDDTHYAIRVSRAPAVRDPLVAALFGPAGTPTIPSRNP